MAPIQGRVTFETVTFRYSPDGPLVLVRDESGSMEGDPHATAVALEWALLEICRREGFDPCGESVDHRVDLAGLQKQFPYLAHRIPVIPLHICPHARAGAPNAVPRQVLARVPRWPPRVRQVPGKGPEAPHELVCGIIVGIEIPRRILVRTGPGVVIADRFANGVVGIPICIVHIRQQPVIRLAGRGIQQCRLNPDSVAAIGHGKRTLVALLADHVAVGVAVSPGIDQFIEVALGQAVGFEERGIIIPLRSGDAIEIAVIIIGRFLRASNDSPVIVV